MPVPAEPLTKIVMSSGTAYSGYLTSTVRAEAILAVGQESGVLVLVLWSAQPGAEGSTFRTIYLRKSAIESVE